MVLILGDTVSGRHGPDIEHGKRLAGWGRWKWRKLRETRERQRHEVEAELFETGIMA